MAEMDLLLKQCVSICGAPENANEKQFLQVIQKYVPAASIQRLKFLKRSSFKKWVLWMDSSESVDCLCGETNEEEINIGYDSYIITFNRCEEDFIPDSWAKDKESTNRTSQRDNLATGQLSGSTRGPYSFNNTFEEEWTENSPQEDELRTIKLSNLPADIDDEFLEMFFEGKYGSDIMVKVVEFFDSRAAAILHFQKQGVTDLIMKNQPFEMEGHLVPAEVYTSQDHEDDEPKTIEVTADKGVINERSFRTIKMYFSNNARSGGGKIAECSLLPGSELIQIIFESAAVARNVSERDDHKYKEHTLDVVLLDAELLKKRKEAKEAEEKPTAIKITNLPDGVDKSILELFFEDAETFGKELRVVDVEIDSKYMTAFVEFEESEDVDIIMTKQPLELEGQDIHIEVQDEQSQLLPCTVEVKGPDELLTKKTLETLKMYFKSTKRSGGGNIIGCNLTEPGLAEITFETNEVARRVVEKDDHIFKSQHLDVCLKPLVTKRQDISVDQANKILISGAEDLDGDTLALHLEDMFEGVHVVNVDRDEEHSSTVVVELDGSDSIQTILNHQTICIEGHTLSVQLFKDEPLQLCTVEVRGLSNFDSCLDILKLYFKNKARSGGGTINKCTTDSNEDIVYLTFESEEVAQRVVNKPDHSLKGQPLQVSLHRPVKKVKHRTHSSSENMFNKKIVITGLPNTIDEQFMELFFEDFGSTNEIQVESVEINPEDCSAVVEFHDPSAVNFILQRQPLEMKGQEITIQMYQKQELSTVEVRGPTNIGKQLDKLQLYFKNKKRSGGGVIVKSTVDNNTNAAYFTFESQEVAERVVNTDHSKQGLEVTLVTERYQSGKTTDQSISTVKVRGIGEKLTKETLSLYFENEKRSGGGPIESITDDMEDRNTIYIRFSDPEDAKNVVKREQQVQGCRLYVCLYVPPPCYDDKFLIKGFKSTKDTLFLFLEATAQAEPISIDYHEEEEDTVVVTMKSRLEFEKLEKACQERPLEGTKLKVSRIPVSNCLFVSNLGPDVTKDTIEYYFENRQKSGGGCVEKIVFNQTDDGERSCLVYFEDYKVIDNIMQRQHTLGNKVLDVKVFQSAIGRVEGETGERPFEVPKAIDIKNADSHKMQFIAKSPDFRKAFEQDLLQYYAKISWPTKAQNNVQLHCILTKDVENSFKRVKSWERQAKDAFEKRMLSIALSRIDILQEIKPKVIEFLKSIQINDPSNVAIFVENEQKLICIVGKKDVADDLRKKIEAEIEKIIEDAEKERQKIKEVFTNSTPIETKLMELENVPQNLEQQFTDLRVKIIHHKNEIQLEGMISSVQSAKLAIYDRKTTYQKMRIENISILSMSLLKTDSISKALHQKLQASGIIAVWEIDAKGIEVCCTKLGFSEKAVQIIRTYLKEETILIQRGNVPDLETDKWRSKVEAIHTQNPGKVKIALSDDVTKVHVSATADVMTSVLQEIKIFIDSNTVVTKNISCFKEVHRLIDKHYRSEVKDISKQLQHYYVDIKMMEQYKGYEIRGVQKGVQEACFQLQKLFDRTKQKKHTVTKPGIAEHIRSVKGKDSMHTIETTLSCIITVEGDESYQEMTNKAYKKEIFASCKIFQTRNINVWKGDLTELEVDVIVNPSDKNLGFSGGLGKALIAKGGLTIKHECENYRRQHGDLMDGDVFVSSAGDLKANNIAHIKSQEWKQGKDMDKLLEETVFKCLSEASKLQAKSVAIPAIGCGVNRFPVEIATSSIVKAIQKMFLEYQDSSVYEIYLCDMNEKNVQGFTQALGVTFGRINVETHDNVQPGDGRDNDFSISRGARPKLVTTPRNPHAADTNPLLPCTTVGRTAITVVTGEIAKETVDVIVNTTSHNLDLRNGAVSLTLLNSAGIGIQNELSAKYPNGLKGIDVAVSGGHKLNCQIVIHTALPNFNDKKPKESIKILHTLMKNCLREAQKQNYCSIAFPAIGTGNLGFPREVVAEEMFKAVSDFQKKNPQSCINDVRFIVYQMDSQTVTAFKSEEARIQKELQTQDNSGQTDQTARSQGYDVIQSGTDYSGKSVSGIFSFGSITVKTKQGDITQEDTDCIVNSSNEDLNLTIGKVSKTLLQLGGKELREEIENHKDEMKKHKIAVTVAPGLPCKSIIHVVAEKKDLIKTVKTCLHEAENAKFTSIALPALAAGSVIATKKFDSGAAQEIAKSMIKAVREFSKTPPKYLLEVRFIIFESELFQEFQRIAEDAGDPKTWLGNVWQGVKSVFGMSGPTNGKGDGTTESEEKYNSVTFLIMALEDDVIRKAIKKLENSLEKEMHTKVIDDPTIKQLEDHQVDEMNGIAMQCRVQMTMDKNRGIIKLSGIVGNVMNASDKINSLLRDAERMELMRNIAQWFYIEVTKTGEKVRPYEKDINLTIENAYRQQKDSVAFVGDNIDYIVDFALMKEYPEHDKNDVVTVIRRDLVKGGYFELPTHWDDMQGGNLRVVGLKQDSPEYKDLEQKFKDSAQKYKDASGQLRDWTVTKIERVQNKTLWEQYQSKKKQLDEQNPTGTINERELWHGTSADPVDSINAHGFNRSFCGKNATVYGDGIYFAINAIYSCQTTYSRPDINGIKRMYLCLVLTGEYAKGEKGMRVPPPKTNAGPNALYDSVSNDVKNPHMFIIFHDTQACPEYIIYFKE